MASHPPAKSCNQIILILGDQLSQSIPSLAAADKSRDVVLIAELWDEATYVRHHKKKIAFVFSAMRHFAAELRADGWRVDYHEYDAQSDIRSFDDVIASAIERLKPERIVVVEPGEHRLRHELESWRGRFEAHVDILEDTRFVCTHDEFKTWASGRKSLRMEYFYREMRRKTGLLMDGDQPVGGKWNYDAENRKPAKADLFMPRPAQFSPDDTTLQVLDLVEAEFADHFGALKPFWFAVTRTQAEAAFDAFINEALPRFGDYQDAMLTGEPFLYHAVVSAYLNIGLLDPLDMCLRVEAAYRAGDAPLNAAEGFIRQIIGWREYVRGIYWLRGPSYVEENFFDASRPLPEFYWTGETELACIKAAVTQTHDEAYAHHIQRLMVTGNFAMLAGVDPRHVHEWYLAVYADAYEWVELPNTLGMSQFADGGLLGSKPYAASGNYIHKMSNYCGGCRYDVKQKTGPDACPFNPL
ncbi:MAG: cryptochrome/photolyase family protein, partial [Pseudomonadota bacterium]